MLATGAICVEYKFFVFDVVLEKAVFPHFAFLVKMFSVKGIVELLFYFELRFVGGRLLTAEARWLEFLCLKGRLGG
jgi:hypothetical protein